VPRRTLRLRVGGLVLAVQSPRVSAALEPPPELGPFLSRRGGDIRLSLTDETPPRPDGECLFDSGGVWRVHRHGKGLLYDFRIPGRRPPVYKAVAVDSRLREGRLYFPGPNRPAAGGLGPGHSDPTVSSAGLEGGPRFALDYPLDELLFQHRLAREGAVEVHACGLVWRDRAVVLCGQSGAGKSTTARLWRRHTRGTQVLSDDRMVLRPSGRGVRAWGTPWHGDGGFASPESRPLGALFFLRHGRQSTARPLGPADAAARLLARSFPPPWDARAMARALETCAAVTASVPAWELAFRPDRTAIDAVREAVTGSHRPS
jgi:hypothetical protein